MVEAEIRSMEGIGTTLTVVDIDSDPALHDKYRMRLPVVTAGGKEVFEAKMIDPQGRWKVLLRSLLRAC